MPDAKPQVKQTAKPVAPKEEIKEPVLPVEPEVTEEDEVEEEVASTPEPVVEQKLVEIRSADPRRQLEVSIGESHWKGVSISVPENQEADVRDILERGGYLLKD